LATQNLLGTASMIKIDTTQFKEKANQDWGSNTLKISLFSKSLRQKKRELEENKNIEIFNLWEIFAA
jgi:hypothetical protein